MFFLLAAIAFGILRWPWWSLPPVIAASLAWLWYVELIQSRQHSGRSNDIRTALNDESTMITMAMSTAAVIVFYIMGRAVRALTYGSGETKTPSEIEPED